VAAQSPRTARDLPLVAWMELSHLRALRILPESVERAPIALERRTPVYDLNGQLLFWRIPLGEARGVTGTCGIGTSGWAQAAQSARRPSHLIRASSSSGRLACCAARCAASRCHGQQNACTADWTRMSNSPARAAA